MIAIQGEDIDLTLFLTKNKTPYTGQTVAVTVSRQENGFVEVLDQSLTEQSPGIYSWKWTNVPNVQLQYIAEYLVNNQFTVAEEINVVSFAMGEVRSAIEEMAGVIEDTETLSAYVEDTLELGIVVNDIDEVAAVIEDTQELEAVISDTEQLAGAVQDPQ
jgi:hypothetical protein